MQANLPLAKVDVLEGLTPEEVEHLTLLSTSVYLGAGETFVLDEDCRTLLLLVSGRVRVQEPNAAGPGLTISMVEDPTVVTQTGFAARSSRAVVVEALEPSVLRVLEGEDFEDLVHRNPEVRVKMIRLLGERLAACEVRLSDIGPQGGAGATCRPYPPPERTPGHHNGQRQPHDTHPLHPPAAR